MARRSPMERVRVAAVCVVLALLGALALYLGQRDDRESGPGARPVETRGQAALDDVRAPSADQPLRLWVGGDSLAAGPSWAVFNAARETAVIRPLAEYQVGTGLVRSEFWDWHRHMDGVVRARNPEVIVFMMGANDDQPLAVDGVSHRPPEPAWVEEYRRRVDALMDLLVSEGRRVLWLGMPPMRDAEYSASMALVNGVYEREAAEHPGVTYVDVWSMFSSPEGSGNFAPALPDEAGALVEVRLDDGIHLNVEGSERLARAVMEILAGFVPLSPVP